MPERIVVIGASAAGLRAAARAKRLMPGTEVVVLDRETVISYGACGLPYYLSGDIESLRPLRSTAWGAVRDPAYFSGAKALDVRIGKNVTAIDRQAKEVRFVDLGSGEETTLGYDKLVIAGGARPKGLPGVPEDHPRVSFFKTTEDAVRWRQALERNELDSMAIIGAGYIGIELAEAFKSMWGCEVDLIEGLAQVLAQVLDPEMAALVQAHLAEQGVRLHLGHFCQSLEEEGDILRIRTGERAIEVQHAICAIGVGPASGLAASAGLAVGPAGGITVDEYLRTSDPDIFAAGDCIEVIHRVTGRPAHVPLGSLANRQGRAVGDNLAGRRTRFGPVAGSGAVKVFDFNVASTGLSQAACEREGIACEAVWGAFSDKAHYYPEDKNICCKLVYGPGDGRLLGMQVVGPGEGVKRVDVLANLLHRSGTVDDLLDLEFCYAPPYASAIDALFTLGCAAGNQMRDGVRSVAPTQDPAGYQVLDVRTADEAEARPAPGDGVIHIPIEELRARMAEIPRERTLLVYCAKGARSGEAVRMLLQNGYEGAICLGGGHAMRT